MNIHNTSNPPSARALQRARVLQYEQEKAARIERRLQWEAKDRAAYVARVDVEIAAGTCPPWACRCPLWDLEGRRAWLAACKAEQEREKAAKYAANCQIWRELHREWDAKWLPYSAEARRLTKRAERKNLDQIRGHELRGPGYALDHIIPISWAIHLDWTPCEVAHPSNLQYITKQANASKHSGEAWSSIDFQGNGNQYPTLPEHLCKPLEKCRYSWELNISRTLVR